MFYSGEITLMKYKEQTQDPLSKKRAFFIFKYGAPLVVTDTLRGQKWVFVHVGRTLGVELTNRGILLNMENNS
jgi:hypothetical protein